MIPSILKRIKDHKINAVRASKRRLAFADLEKRAHRIGNRYPVMPFRSELEMSANTSYGLIAEIKRASPKKGVIRNDSNTSDMAKAYEAGGATCLSVLTDMSYFNGFPDDLLKAREACNLPLLCKDFLVDPYQVVEARSWGADCILIIMAMLEDNAVVAAIEEEAIRWNMDVLVEVHTDEELERAKALRSRMIGINNRNLFNFDTTLEITRNLAKKVPSDYLIVCASGLSTPEDLADMARHGARCFLVGEALMRQPDLKAATQALLANPVMKDSL